MVDHQLDSEVKEFFLIHVVDSSTLHCEKACCLRFLILASGYTFYLYT